MRRGELFRLRWADIDFANELITLRKPKGGKTVTIPVSQKALEVLQEFPVKSEYVFPSRNGMRTDFKRPWERIKKAAGLTAELRFHDLRRNFASMLVSESVPRMMLLTHKDIKTTQRYAHLSHESLHAGAKKADKLLNVQDKDQSITLSGTNGEELANGSSYYTG